MNIFRKWQLQWHQKNLQKFIRKQQQEQLKKQSKERVEVIQKLQLLYGFVKELNTKLIPNRKQRKAFWSKVRTGEPVLENTINNLVEQYKAMNKRARAQITALKNPPTPKKQATSFNPMAQLADKPEKKEDKK